MKYFQTSDFPLSTTLISNGFKLDHIDRSDISRVQFCFERSEELDENVQAFWRGDLRIEPKTFCVNQKLLKSQLYSQS